MTGGILRFKLTSADNSHPGANEPRFSCVKMVITPSLDYGLAYSGIVVTNKLVLLRENLNFRKLSVFLKSIEIKQIE